MGEFPPGGRNVSADPSIAFVALVFSVRFLFRFRDDWTVFMSASYLELFPVHGRVFEERTGKWRASVVNSPQPSQGSDRLLFQIDLNPVESPAPKRHLRLWVSMTGLHTEAATYIPRLYTCIETWLGTSDEIVGDVKCFGG